MTKRFFPLLLMLALLLCGAVSFGKQSPGLSTARIDELRGLAGENGAQWIGGTPPSSDMNAFQMWQWTDWFLSNRVRSLLSTIQDYEQLEPGVPLNAQAEEDQWQLRETENSLSRFEAQLEEDRLTILNGISLYQSDEISDTERQTVCKRILEAESEIRQIIRTICADYDTYLESVDNCSLGLQATYDGYTLDVHDAAYNSLIQSAEALETSENAAAADFSVSVISTHQFRIRVCTPDQRPIKNATVTVTNALNETQKQAATDAQGDAVFWAGDLGADEKGEMLLNLHIEAEGYRTREMQTVSLRRGETRSIDLQKDDGTPYLIMGSLNGKDILTETNFYYCSQENTANHTFTVKLHCDTDGELELRYSVDAEATEYRTVVKTFSAADSDNTVLEFEDQWLSKLLPGAKVSFTIKAGGKQYTTDTLLLIQKAIAEKPILNTLFPEWNKTLWEGKLDLSQNSAIAPTGEKYKLFDSTGAHEPILSATNSITYGSSGVEPTETQQVFSQIDSATEDFQYAVIGDQTYLFWIQPVTPSGTNKVGARLWWRNLNDPTKFGDVGILSTNSIPNANDTENGSVIKRSTYADYDFAVEVSQGVNNQGSSFCALTILSGQFSGTSPQAPDSSILTTVLMKQTETKGLDIVFYQEHEREFTKDNYAVMPEVFLTASGDSESSVYLVSTCTSSDDRKNIYGQVVYKETNGLDGLMDLSNTSFKDGYGITRYHVGIPSSANNVNVYSLNEAGELSRLNLSGTSSGRDLLAQGNIINFQVYTQLEGSNAKDRLFYLDQVEQVDGTYIQRLKCVTLDLMNSSAAPVSTDYGVEINTDHFDIVKFDSGVYLYWTECSTPDPANSEAKAKYVVRCLRYDPGTDTVCGPFNMVELSESPNTIKLQDSGTGFYSVDLQNSLGSYLRQSLSRFTFGQISSAEMTAAVLNDPCVSAGDYTELAFSVMNTGNVPLSAFDVEIIDTETDALVQTLHIDLDNPELSANHYYFHDASYTITGTDALRRIRSMYDPLNHESWEITSATAAGSTVRSVRTDLLMPGDTHSYQTKIQIPADWKGKKTLVARIAALTGESALSGRQTEEELLLIGASQPGNTAQSAPTERLGSEAAKEIDTDSHDLMLSAQLFQRSGEGYVHITIRNRSGNKNSDITPILTASYHDETLYSHTFLNPMSDDFGYSMDIPLQTLMNGQSLPELDLYVSNADSEDFADADNHVRLLTAVQLCIVDQPISISATEGEEALFSVTAAGGEKPYRYQWQCMTGIDQWTDIPGADLNTYRIASILLEQNGMNLRCVITDQFGNSVTSDPAALSVLPKIAPMCIVDQPVNVSASEGEAAVFSVAVDGGKKPYRYQWQCTTGMNQWTDIPGADQNTYRIASVQTKQNGMTVRCVITDQLGNSIASVSAALSVLPKIVPLCIVNQPVNVSASEGEEAVFSVTAVGGEKPYRYQWQRMTGTDQWTDIPDADLDTYRIASLQPDQNGMTVRCVITDQLGNSITSDSAELSVLPKIVPLCIVDQPVSISVSAGEEAVFSVTVEGGEKPYHYQWQHVTGTDQWTDIPGADQNTYRIASLQPDQNGTTVRCVITDQLGNSVTSDPAELSVLPKIVPLCIVDQPVSISVSEGEEAVFSVTVEGGEKPYHYQWQHMTGMDQWTNIPGADQNTYCIASVQTEQNGTTVRCVITDQLGNSVTSDSAALSVLRQQQTRSHLLLWLLPVILSVAVLAIVLYRKRSK